MEIETCEHCFYYEEFETGNDTGKGFCHRKPPYYGIVRTTFDWWCGEFVKNTNDKKINVEGNI